MGYLRIKTCSTFLYIKFNELTFTINKIQKVSQTDKIKGTPKLLFENVSEKPVLTSSDWLLS